MEHFREDELLLFVAALTERQATVVHHLVGCAPCRRRAAPPLTELAQPAGERPAPAEDGALAEVWPRLARRWRARAAAFERERAAAGPLLDELLATPRERRAVLLREPRFHSLALALTLLERGGLAADREPAAAEELAGLVLNVAGRLPDGGASRDLQSQAWTLVGYAQARRGEIAGAELAFRTASDLLGDQDSIEAAALARRLGGMRRALKRPLEAIALFQRAANLFAECGDAAQESLALEEQAMTYADLGDLERTVALLSRSFLLAQRAAGPEAALSGRLMLAQLLLRFGRAAQAEAVLAKASAEGVEDPVLRALLAVARAQSAALAGEVEAAGAWLEAAFREAMAAGAAPAAALAGIQLASLRVRQGRRRDLVRLARHLAVAAARPVPARVRAGLRRLRNELAAGTADHGLVAQVWREAVAALPEAGARAGLLALTGDLLPGG